jgi:hypothetical protein
LKNVRDAKQGPILLHVVTQKGKGYAPAEASADKYHGVSKFNVVTGAQVKPKPNAPTYTRIFAESLIKQAEKDEKIVAITAAMPDGTGLDLFGARLRPDWRPKATSRSLRSTRRSCSAPTIRSCMTLPFSAFPYGLLWIAPVSWGRMDQPMRVPTILPISAAFRTWF